MNEHIFKKFLSYVFELHNKSELEGLDNKDEALIAAILTLTDILESGSKNVLLDGLEDLT